MEKVQVDAKKLQLLNDRINQTIDALNQLRITAQQAGFGAGIGHTGSPLGQPSYGAFAQSQQFGAPWGVFGLPYASSPYASTPYVGMGHSSFVDPSALAAARQAELAMVARGIGVGVPQQTLGIGAVGSTGGFGHSTAPYRNAATEVLLGAVDPVARQLEIARACAENRAWEISQGLGHSSVSPMSSAYAAGNPWHAASNPWHATSNPYAASNPYFGFGPQSWFG
jgi:hypothetical protein